MENYFSEIYGQKRVTDNLFRIWQSGKIPHAFIFIGPEGCGKFLTAVRFAQLTNSSSNTKPQDDAILRKINLLLEPYIKYIIPLPRGKNETGSSSSTEKLDKESLELLKEEIENKIANPYYRIKLEKANNIKITSIREIKKFVSLNYDDIKYRFILISDAHLMNDEAQNALLKSLEEPPEGIIFILTTNDTEGLLPTIFSRCRKILFDPLGSDDLAKILINHFRIEKDVAEKVAPFANGSLYNALDFIKNDFDQLLNKTINILRYSLALKFHSAYNEISELSGESSGNQLKLLIQMIITWLGDVQKNKVGYNNYVFRNHIDTLEKFNQRFSQVDIIQTISNFESLISAIESNANLNIVILNIIFEIESLRLF